MPRLVQLQGQAGRTIVAMVEEPHLRLIGYMSIYELIAAAIDSEDGLSHFVFEKVTAERLDYSQVYEGQSAWRLMPPIHHPEGPGRTLVSGTGLTHLGSAKNRQAMHSATEENLTDSMKMFRWGIAGGKPPEGQIGIAPEWFYKGSGAVLRAPGEPLDVPAYAEGGGEEAEIVGIYLIGPDGTPHRIGMCTGNEFADHKFEKRNYLNLAGSKMRNCSIGPELVIDPKFDSVSGEARIDRGGSVLWSKPVRSGEAEMCHSLQNIEHHHFKFEDHRRPGDLHVHYFGAHSLSFGDGIQLIDGDMMVIQWEGFGRALRNPVRIVPPARDHLVKAISLA
jgi:hypothetical protein